MFYQLLFFIQLLSLDGNKLEIIISEKQMDRISKELRDDDSPIREIIEKYLESIVRDKKTGVYRLKFKKL